MYYFMYYMGNLITLDILALLWIAESYESQKELHSVTCPLNFGSSNFGSSNFGSSYFGSSNFGSSNVGSFGSALNLRSNSLHFPSLRSCSYSLRFQGLCRFSAQTLSVSWRSYSPPFLDSYRFSWPSRFSVLCLESCLWLLQILQFRIRSRWPHTCIPMIFSSISFNIFDLVLELICDNLASFYINIGWRQ